MFGLDQEKVYMLAALDEEGDPCALGWYVHQKKSSRGRIVAIENATAIWSSGEKAGNLLANEAEHGAIPGFLFMTASGRNLDVIFEDRALYTVEVGWGVFEGFVTPIRNRSAIRQVAVNPRKARDPKARVYHINVTE